MNRSLLRIVALHLLSTPAVRNLLDWRFGLKLLRDNRVPVRSKLGAFALGFIAFLALEILQLPVQTAMWALLSVAGIVLDFALDGVEFLVISSIVGLLALQFTTPKEIVEQIRGNKANFDNVDQNGRVYDVAGAKVR
jgi:hypothetical protein